MKLTDKHRFAALIRPLSRSREALRMKRFIQHGSITTFDHCMAVARRSFAISRALHLRINESALVRGAFLHDYFLYDWHHSGDHLHGLHHPELAVRNASRDFHITRKEAGIIRTHMWPLTLFHVPPSLEAFVVCIADKLCALSETLHRR